MFSVKIRGWPNSISHLVASRPLFDLRLGMGVVQKYRYYQSKKNIDNLIIIDSYQNIGNSKTIKNRAS